MRDGDTLVVTKLDRLARSLPDARDTAEELTGNRAASLWRGVAFRATPISRLVWTRRRTPRHPGL